MIDFNFSIPTKVLFGAGRLDELKREPLPGRFALVVVSAGKAMRENGYLDRVLAALKHQGIEYLIFDKIRPNPSKADVMEAAQLARDNFCDFVYICEQVGVMNKLTFCFLFYQIICYSGYMFVFFIDIPSNIDFRPVRY